VTHGKCQGEGNGGVTTVSSPLAQNELAPTTCALTDGSVVEPYLRQGSMEETIRKGRYFAFGVSIIHPPPAYNDERQAPASKTSPALVLEETTFAEVSRKILSDVKKHAEAQCQDCVVEATGDTDTSQDTLAFKVDADVKTAGSNAGDTCNKDPSLCSTDSSSCFETPSKMDVDSNELKKCTETVKHCTSLKQDAPSSPDPEKEEFDIDDPRKEILEILEGVDAPGTFAVGGSCGGGLTMPGLTVDGVGTISLPLSEAQAKELVSRFEQAPFGRGTETLVDKTVRNTFQLPPEHFKIMNPDWAKEVNNLVSTVRHDLGVQAHLKVEAQLYKLLLYESGSFFAMHRDSEKVDGMFGTMVIVLPSAFTGGELVVKHQGETEEFDQSTTSSFGSQYIAFYADCKHELKTVTSGYRLCLVYNLVKVGEGVCPKAAANTTVLKRLEAAAKVWGREYDGNKVRWRAQLSNVFTQIHLPYIFL
jgi:predicted 2-oxoglutarate/Fe(II)-dependent dioxygenase YbiX